MTATTDETWTADGVGLNTYAWNIRTLSERSGLPPTRGENDAIPYRPGRLWVPKMYDQRVVPLAMWIVGCDANGLLPTAHSRRAQLNANEDALLRVFGIRHRQITMVRVKRMPSGPLTLTGLVECSGTMSPSMMAGGTRATLTVDLLMADPFWYAPLATESVTSSGATITNPGSAEALDMQVSFVGPLTNPRLVNTTAGIEVRYAGTISSGQTVVLDTANFTALLGATNVIGSVRHVGAPQWMKLRPGANVMALNNWQGGAVGAGSVTVAYRPPYLS